MKFSEYKTYELVAMKDELHEQIRHADFHKDVVQGHDLRCALDQCVAELESLDEEATSE